MAGDPLLEILKHIAKNEQIPFSVLFEAFVGYAVISLFNHWLQVRFTITNILVALLFGLTWGYWTPLILISILIVYFIIHKISNKSNKDSENNDSENKNGES